jgi:hypothetical protein
MTKEQEAKPREKENAKRMRVAATQKVAKDKVRGLPLSVSPTHTVVLDGAQGTTVGPSRHPCNLFPDSIALPAGAYLTVIDLTAEVSGVYPFQSYSYPLFPKPDNENTLAETQAPEVIQFHFFLEARADNHSSFPQNPSTSNYVTRILANRLFLILLGLRRPW